MEVENELTCTQFECSAAHTLLDPSYMSLILVSAIE